MKDLFLYQDDGISIVYEPEFTRIRIRVLQDGSALFVFLLTPLLYIAQKPLSVGNANATFIQLYPRHHIFWIRANVFCVCIDGCKKEMQSCTVQFISSYTKNFLWHLSAVFSLGANPSCFLAVPSFPQLYSVMSKKRMRDMVELHLANEFKYRCLAKGDARGKRLV